MSKWRRSADPQAEREAASYENPIPSREFIIAFLEEKGIPETHSSLCSEMEVVEEEQQVALLFRLKAMVRDGQLLKNRKGSYTLLDKLNLIKGRVQGHREGFGFLLPDDGSADLYISAREMRRVFDKDRVLVRETDIDRKGRRECSIVDILERNTSQLVGRYHEESGACYVVPENNRISQEVMITPGALMPTEGQYVLVELIEQPERRRSAIGIVKDILGDKSTPGLEVEVALHTHSIPNIWPDEVTQISKKLSSEVAENHKSDRFDLRHLTFVTIDGEDSRDFDDAVYCEKVKGVGWRLFVAIADVAQYVNIDTALDKEALNRGNSVYFPGHVIPMLPEILSNGLCSLNPQVDRLALVCEMDIDFQGKMQNYCFYEGLICSHARLTYNYVWDRLSDNKVLEGEETYLESLKQLYDLYRVLNACRQDRGAINFETADTQIIFDSNRKVESIVLRERNDAHKLIEECMLCANTASAEFMIKHGLPGLYRVHEGPKPEKRQAVDTFLKSILLSLPKGDASPKDIQKLLDSVKGRADFQVIQLVLLRSMSQAVYTPDNQGHFGLALNAYTHFTSPIRRYSDLVVHRIIRSVIHSDAKTQHVRRIPSDNKEKKISFSYKQSQIDEIALHCSKTERRADDATRDAVSWLKCEYMQQHIGEKFSGTITSVLGFGLFVVLDKLFVEGLVHISSLPGDYYTFDAGLHRLTGERTGRTYRISDEVDVTVMRVDLDSKQIDFEIIVSDDIKSKTNGDNGEENRRRRSVAAKNKLLRAARAEQKSDNLSLVKKKKETKQDGDDTQVNKQLRAKTGKRKLDKSFKGQKKKLDKNTAVKKKSGKIKKKRGKNK